MARGDEHCTGPPAGIRVFGVTVLTSTLLVDLGADVIKLERTNTGDFSSHLARNERRSIWSRRRPPA